MLSEASRTLRTPPPNSGCLLIYPYLVFHIRGELQCIGTANLMSCKPQGDRHTAVVVMRPIYDVTQARCDGVHQFTYNLCSLLAFCRISLTRC